MMLAQSISELSRFVEYGIGIAAFALVAWIVRHVTTKTIPKLVSDFREALKEQGESFERMNRETRQEFRDILESDRQRHYEREEAIRAEFREAIQAAACRHEGTD